MDLNFLQFLGHPQSLIATPNQPVNLLLVAIDGLPKFVHLSHLGIIVLDNFVHVGLIGLSIHLPAFQKFVQDLLAGLQLQLDGIYTALDAALERGRGPVRGFRAWAPLDVL